MSRKHLWNDGMKYSVPTDGFAPCFECGCNKGAAIKGQIMVVYKGQTTLAYIGKKSKKNYGAFENGKSYWIEKRDFDPKNFSQ